jgi:hypothetical protein
METALFKPHKSSDLRRCSNFNNIIWMQCVHELSVYGDVDLTMAKNFDASDLGAI